MQTRSVTRSLDCASPRPRSLGWLSPRDRFEIGELAAVGHAAVSLAAIETLGWLRQDGEFGLPSPIVYRQLLPSSLSLWSQEFKWGLKVTPRGSQIVALDWPEVAGLTSSGPMSRAGIKAWLQAELEQMPISARHVTEILNHPERLVLRGYSLIRWSRAKNTLDMRRFTVCLAMIGLGSRFFFNGDRCGVCYRWAEPSLDRCRHHSQSKLNANESARTAATLAHAARVARRVIKRLDIERHAFIPSSSGIFCIAGILWPTRSDQALGTRDALLNAMSEAPLVSRQVPRDFSAYPYRQQLRMLRAAIDPNDWSAVYWSRRVEVAQAWAEKEASVAPGRTGPSELNQKRIAVAFELLAAGRSKSEIATKLAVSRSHLSKLLARHGHIAAD